MASRMQGYMTYATFFGRPFSSLRHVLSARLAHRLRRPGRVYSGDLRPYRYAIVHIELEGPVGVDVGEEQGRVSPNPGAGPLEDFRGFRFLPQAWTVDWSFFFDTGGPRTSRQASRAIDTRLAEGLFSLPGAPAGMDSLALLNLRRGRALGLPSGQRVATAVGVQDLTREELGFWEPAPLWFYVLKESELRHGGTRIGPVGGRIVAEVLLGMLAADPASFVHASPAWIPSLPAEEPGRFTMTDLLRFAGAT